MCLNFRRDQGEDIAQKIRSKILRLLKTTELMTRVLVGISVRSRSECAKRGAWGRGPGLARYLGSRGARRRRAGCRRRAAGAAPASPAAPAPSRRRALPQHTRSRHAAPRMCQAIRRDERRSARPTPPTATMPPPQPRTIRTHGRDARDSRPGRCRVDRPREKCTEGVKPKEVCNSERQLP